MQNIICLQGRLVADPELKQTTSGKSVTSFRIANDIGYGEKKVTNWITCVAWEKVAELIVKNYGKGDMIFLSGSLRSREYEKDGKKHTVNEVVVSEIYFIDNKKKTDAPAATPSASYGSPADSGRFEEVSTDEDFPF